MPGILPMKVIKVGTAAQSRIAQACDRCRSKKIKCDGKTPTCTQCSNVGFECKTSDKLSRRAFPRGYTESLEERVRALESEVRELKDLLDEKDEKIDMLAKMHSNRRASSSSTASSSVANAETVTPVPSKEDTFHVLASPLLLDSDNSDAYFMGVSSGRGLIDALRRKIQESGRSCTAVDTSSLLNTAGSVAAIDTAHKISGSLIPPRLFSDRCVNVFFQEWAPLFPIVHRQTFLRLYEEYGAHPETVTDDYKLAQVHLVFTIAGLSSDLPDKQNVALCEDQWQKALDKISSDNNLQTLQILVLAMLYCIVKGDYKKLQHYKGISVGLSHRLGLHQSQKRFAFGALTMETRKKVFWTLYTVDCFSAAMLGLPRMLKEDDIHCEYPADIDDEYVTEKGFLPTLPGEFSKISSALALFRVSRILAKVLEQNYPAAATHELSVQSLQVLEAEVNEWSDDLPRHLKLNFIQGKPSTDVTGSRSALLSLAYYYIRTLIHRPALGSSLGEKASSSVLSVAESSKHIIQIVQLLEERSMSFSFCLNKVEMLTLCGLGLLYQVCDLKPDSSLTKDAYRVIGVVVRYLDRFQPVGAGDFRRLALSILPIEPKPSTMQPPVNSEIARPVQASRLLSSGSAAKNHAAPHQSDSHSVQEKDSIKIQHKTQDQPRHSTAPNPKSGSLGRHSNGSNNPLESFTSHSPTVRHEYYPSASSSSQSLAASSQQPQQSPSHNRSLNLDYLSFNTTPAASKPPTPGPGRHNTSAYGPTFVPSVARPATNAVVQHKSSIVTPAEWESLLSSLDGGQANIYDAMYGGPHPSLTLPVTMSPQKNANHSSSLADSLGNVFPDSTWSSDSWDMSALNMHDFDLGRGRPFDPAVAAALNPQVAQSVLSFSEESLSSGDEVASAGEPWSLGSGTLDVDHAPHNGMINGEEFLIAGLDGNYGV